MKIIQKLQRILRLLFHEPRYLNVLLEYDPYWQKKSSEYGLQAGLPVIELAQFITPESTVIEPFAFLDGGSLPTDIALLSGLAQQINDCRYFEIGTWRGESVANVARFAKSCDTLNLSPEELRKLGLSEAYIDAHAFFSKDLNNVNHLYGNSKTFDFEGLKQKFDLVFIDGDHHYEFVKNDTQRVFRDLIHENTIVVWHDYAHDPEHPRFEVLAGILDGLPHDLHQYLYHVENTLCAIFIRRKLPVTIMEYPSTVNNLFKINFEINKTHRI